MYWKRLTGFTALDCWFERQLEWERWLVGWLFLNAKTCWTSGDSRFPHHPRAARVQIEKIRSSVKRLQAERLATDVEKKKKGGGGGGAAGGWLMCSLVQAKYMVC